MNRSVKTIKITILIIVLFSFKIFGQDKKTYFNEHWKETKDSVGAEYYRIVHKTKDSLNKKVFKVKDYYKNNVIQMQGTYLDKNLSKKNGLFIWYYKNGNKDFEVKYVKNKKYDEEKKFYENGPLKALISYSENKKNGELRSFYENGEKKRIDIYKDDSLISGKCFTITGQDTSYFPWGKNALFRNTSDLKVFRDLVQLKVRYPEELAKAGMEGRVFVQFLIDSTGKQCEFKILLSSHPLFSEAAIKAVTQQELWEPAIEDGKKVKQKFTIPVTFRLQN